MKSTLYPARQSIAIETDVDVVCFPHAGGNVHSYHAWARFMPPSIGLRVYQAPGRGLRVQEPPVTDLASMVEEVVRSLDVLTRKPRVFYGHSFGGLLAYKVMCRLRKMGAQLPQHFIASASLPPPIVCENKGNWDGVADDRSMFDQLVKIGGVPAELQPHREAFLPMMASVRAEYRILTTYRHTEEPPFPVPLSLFSGEADALVPAENMSGWRQLFVNEAASMRMKGGHFFVDSDAEAVASRVCAIATAIKNSVRGSS